MPFPLRHERPILVIEVGNGSSLVLGVHDIYEFPSVAIGDHSVGGVIRLEDEDKGFRHGWDLLGYYRNGVCITGATTFYLARRMVSHLGVPFNFSCGGGMTFCFEPLREQYVQPNPVLIEITGSLPRTAHPIQGYIFTQHMATNGIAH